MKTHPGEWDAPTIATTLAFICGFIVLGLGLLRLGWIVEFIPAPAVSGFMTGSAINIAASQVPGLFGIANRLECVMPLFCIFSSMTILLQYERSHVLGHHKYIKEPSLFNYRCSIRRGWSCWYVVEPSFFQICLKALVLSKHCTELSGHLHTSPNDIRVTRELSSSSPYCAMPLS